MFALLFKHSFRALSRQKAYIVINAGGLAIGIACSLIIGLFIVHQLSYDQYHEDKDRIYQLVLNGIMGGEEFTGAYTASPIGPAMVRELPEVESCLRLNGFNETVIKYEDKFFVEEHFVEADSTFFDFFDIPLLRGNPKEALNQSYTVVLTETMAARMFDTTDPIDKMIRVGTNENLYRVTGVMADIPENTHFKANAIGSFITNSRAENSSWLSNSFSTFVMLHPEASTETVQSGLNDLILKYVGPELRDYLGITIEDFLNQGNKYNIFLQPLTDIHLNPAIEQQLATPNDPRYLRIFGSIGVLILIIGAVNFMNLSTAQATKRAKEVGVKKACGSSKGLLMFQFLSETILLALMAMILGILMVELSLPFVNNLLQTQLSFDYLAPWYTIPALFLIAFLIGTLAGIYPAFYLSSFNPVRVLKGKAVNGSDLGNLRRILTVLQFSISIVLIVGSLIMHRQINFMLNKDLGFDKEHVLVIRRAGVLAEQVKSFKNELLGLSGVVSVSASTAVPGRVNNNNGHAIQGRPEETFLMQTCWVDYDFLQTYKIEMAEGRFFSPDMLTDQQACILNQRAVKNFSLTNPLQTRILDGDTEESVLPVIGVTRDFHFESLRNDIRPSIMKFKQEDMNWGYISIRLSPGSPQTLLEQINQIWASYTEQEPMLYFFMDKELTRMYSEEKQNAILSVIFTLLAIIIASLGLYGLTTFTIAQKTKEIGVRKTFGASTLNIWYRISREIIILIAISTIIAWPVIYWVADEWLQNYQYRIALNPLDFLKGLLLAAGIALLTISYRAIKAASINPSLSLRYE